jgi:hypothetical protein
MAKKQLPRGLRNCNPGNIRKNSIVYAGEIVPSQDDEFKQFVTMAYGYRAMFVLLYTYQHRYGLDSIAQMIARYAPENENNTAAYIDVVAERSGVPANGHITATNGDVMIPIVAAMARVELDGEPKLHEVEEGWKLFISDWRNKLL